eukprot:gene24865-30042_t
MGDVEDRTALYYERAKQLNLLSSGTSVELERQLREVYKALSYQNEQVRLYMLLGKIYKQNLDLSSALFCYRFVLKKEPTNPTAQKYLVQCLTLKGKELMTQGIEGDWKAKFISARSLFDEAIEYNRDSQELCVLKAVCQVRLQEFGEAFDTISKACQSHKNPSAEVFILRAKINWARGLVEQGNQDIRQAAGIDPSHSEVLSYIERTYAKSEKLYMQAVMLFTKEKYKEALEPLAHALFLTSEDVKLHILQSKILRLLGKYQEAYESILKAEQIFNARREMGAGKNAYDQQMPSELQLQMHLIFNEMAMQYVQKGEYINAICLYNKIIKDLASHSEQYLSSHSDLYRYFVNRADCYRAISKFPEAILDYTQAYKLCDTDWNINIRLSMTYYLVALELYNSSDFIQADEELTKAIKYNPKVPEYFALRGKARYYMVKHKEAYEDFKEVVKLDPSNTEIQHRLQQFEADDSDLLKDHGQINPHALSAVEFVKYREERLKDVDPSLLPLHINEKVVNKVEVDQESQISMMLNPKQVKVLPIIKMLADPSLHAKKEKKGSSIEGARLNSGLTNSFEHTLGHIVMKPALAASAPLVSKTHAFKRAIVASEAVHKKSVEVVQEYMKSSTAKKGAMWEIVDTARQIAAEKMRERTKQLFKNNSEGQNPGKGRRKSVVSGVPL